jgi:hypothetical protein
VQLAACPRSDARCTSRCTCRCTSALHPRCTWALHLRSRMRCTSRARTHMCRSRACARHVYAHAQDHYALARVPHAQPYAYTGARTGARSAGVPADVRHAGPHSCTAVRVVASPDECGGAHSVVDGRTARTAMDRVGLQALGVCGAVSIGRLVMVQHPAQTKIINVSAGPNAHANH